VRELHDILQHERPILPTLGNQRGATVGAFIVVTERRMAGDSVAESALYDASQAAKWVRM
jgi:hypothetical protein